MSPGYGRNKYGDAIDKVRSQHESSIPPGRMTVECPRCGTKQVVIDAPGLRRCMKCGYEFKPRAP